MPDSRASDTSRDIVYAIAWMKTGGAQTHLLQVFRLLDRTRFRPHLYCMRDEGDLIEPARQLDVPVTTFSMRGALGGPGELVGLARMTAALRGLRPAVLHAYLLRANFAGAVAARLARVPVVLTSKRGLHAPSGWRERTAVRISNRLSDRIVGNSDHLVEFTRAVEPPLPVPIEMIPNGIDIARFSRTAVPNADRCAVREALGVAEDVPIVGSVMTFRPRKGYGMLFESFARVRRRIPNAVLAIAGEAPMPPVPAELAAKLGITDAIRLLGRRSDMPAVLSTFDVFALASTAEGMSNAMLEAMAMQVPVVITAIGGAPMVIEDGANGWLVPEDDVAAMATRIEALLEAPDARRVMGERARRRVLEEYSAERMVRRMEELYTALLSAG